MEEKKIPIFSSYQEAIDYRANNFTYNHHARLYTIRVFDRFWITKAVIIAPAVEVEAQEFILKISNNFSKYYDELCKDYSTSNQFQIRYQNIQ